MNLTVEKFEVANGSNNFRTATFKGDTNDYIVAIEEEDFNGIPGDAEDIAAAILDGEIIVRLTTVYPNHDEDRETTTDLENWLTDLEHDIEADSAETIADRVA